MADGDVDEPFAAFAVPRPSAVEVWKARQEAERRQARRRWRWLRLVAVGSGVGAAMGATVTADGSGWLWAGAAAGGAGGSLVGASVGGVVWASRTFQGRFISPYQATGADAAAQQWRTMKNWLASWAAIGMVIGASAGAAWAGRWLGNTPAELTFPWAFAGALGGVAVLSGLRLAARRPPDDEAASRP